MSEITPEESAAAQAASPAARGEIDKWLDWMRQMVALVVALGELASAEGRLALGDVKRLLIASIVLVPFLIFSWLSLGVWLSWLVYSLSGSMGYAFFAFFFLQAAVSWYLLTTIKAYRSTLSLPKTRRHVRELLEDIKRGSSKSAP
jgi:hypothetical protein